MGLESRIQNLLMDRKVAKETRDAPIRVSEADVIGITLKMHHFSSCQSVTAGILHTGIKIILCCYLLQKVQKKIPQLMKQGEH